MSNPGNQPSSGSFPRTSPQTVTRDNGTVTIRGFEGQDVSPNSRPRPIGNNPITRTRASTEATGSTQADSEGARMRRPSIAERIGSLGNAGGPNSFNKFAASFQRAAGFYEITPGSRSMTSTSQSQSQSRTDPEEDEASDAVPDLEQGGPSHSPAMKSALGRVGRLSETPFPEDDEEPLDREDTGTSGDTITNLRKPLSQEDGLGVAPPLATSYGGSHGTNYGSLSSRLSSSALRQPEYLSTMRKSSAAAEAAREHEPLLPKRKESEHYEYTVPPGESTLPQTIFNSVNVLVGVGMLSLPLGVLYSGWLIGLGFFLFSAVATSYTAKLLAKCLDVDKALVTFADIAYGSFGHRARIGVSILFTLELLAACVALVILFADSINLLIPAVSVNEWKVVCGFILIPLSFTPLRFLSFSSILGIVCCITIVLAIFVDGFIKPHALGSLLDPAPTYLFPQDWRTLPLAFGLLMAPWGGHSVFPNIYRDMRHPTKYHKAVNITYVFTYIVEVALTVAGYLMFGDYVRDEITANIFLTKGYPRWLSMLIIISITIVPLTKVPLNSRPIISTMEILCGVDARTMAMAHSMRGMSTLARGITRFTIRVLTPVLLVILAILVPSFDRVMSLLGSLACFSICIVLPCAFHLKIFGKELSYKQWILDWTLLVLCSVLAVIGTVCSFVPKEALGVHPKQ